MNADAQRAGYPSSEDQSSRSRPGHRRWKRVRVWAWACLLPWLLTAASANADGLATLVVTNTADSGPGSLRQAILDANASAEGDRIEFGLHLCDPVCVIQPTVALPPLSSGNTMIDGFSQAGAQPPTAGSRAVIRIAIDGSQVENNNGLSLISERNRIHGLAIYNFGWNGIAIAGPEAQSNVVLGNHIGLDADGVGASSRRPNGFDGVFIGLGARSNHVGGDLLTERNVISGNGWGGVGVHGDGTANNLVQGNFIGLDALGAAAVPNSLDGVRMYGGSQSLWVGVLNDVGERNIISGNGRDGIRVAGEGTVGLRADGNLIGTDRAGFNAIPNAGDGVHVLDGARTIQLGGASTPSLGLISGNQGHGIHFERGAGGVTIYRHFIGLDASGQTALPNDDGIHVSDTEGVYIGDGELGKANLISGNLGAGVVLSGSLTTGSLLRGNRIGTRASGTLALSNQGGGVRIQNGASNNAVGARSEDGRAGNLISGNAGNAVEIDGPGSDDNRVVGNRIGSDVGGLLALGNADAGVRVRGGAAGNRIGGFGENEGNWIVANAVGISLQGAGVTTMIYANRIGLGADLLAPALGNRLQGIRIEDGTREARVQGNRIAWNGEQGVLITGEPSHGNWLRQNAIHDNAGLGIQVSNGAQRGIQPPLLSGYDASNLRLSGLGCRGCEVELFSDAADEGAEPLVVGTIGGTGSFGIDLPAAPRHGYFTAIVTDSDAGSSAFSAPLPALASTATPSPTATRTETPAPSSTQTPTQTQTSSPSPSPSPSATPTEPPSATPRPSPTDRPSPSPTASPTASPSPSSTLPVPTATEALPTAGPSTTPEPSATPEPGSTDTAAPLETTIWLPYLARGEDRT